MIIPVISISFSKLVMVKSHWFVGCSWGNGKGQINCRSLSNIGNVWFSSFAITKMTPFPPHQRPMLPKVWSQFPSNAVRVGIIQGSWYISFSLIEPKHDGRTGTVTSHICFCDEVCHNLLKMSRLYKEDEFTSLFMKELGWNPVWVISVFAPAVQNALHFLGFSFMILNKEWLNVKTSCTRLFFHYIHP